MLRWIERIGLPQQRRKHALHRAEQRLRFAKARRQIGNLFVLLRHLVTQEFILALQ